MPTSSEDARSIGTSKVQSFPGIDINCDHAKQLLCWAEAGSVPLLLPGLVASWPAVTNWQGTEGLRRLADTAGDARVQVMVSGSRVFYGDISRHQPADMGFGELLELLLRTAPAPDSGRSAPVAASEAEHTDATDATAAVEATTAAEVSAAATRAAVVKGVRDMNGDPSAGSGSGESSESGEGGGSSSAQDSDQQTSSSAGSDATSRSSDEDDDDDDDDNGGNRSHGSGDGLNVYLAQQPFTGGLARLLGDVPLPGCLAGKVITSSHLWMCGGSVRSSLHYDPHHNLLAVVSGRKALTLIPPHLTPCVYPMTITGDAPNHSQVPFAASRPAARHPAYAAALRAALHVELRAGDALFLPEGWWHQVDSGPETTIAVNYWWQSALTQALTTAKPSAQPPPPPPPSLLAAPAPATLTETAVAARAPAVAAAAAAAPPAMPHASTAVAGAAVPHTAMGASHQPVASPSAAAAMREPNNNTMGQQQQSATTTRNVDVVDLAAPGPGLRNLFALRQLARAAMDDVAQQLLAAVLAAPVLPPQPAATEAAPVLPPQPAATEAAPVLPPQPAATEAAPVLPPVAAAAAADAPNVAAEDEQKQRQRRCCRSGMTVEVVAGSGEVAEAVAALSTAIRCDRQPEAPVAAAPQPTTATAAATDQAAAATTAAAASTQTAALLSAAMASMPHTMRTLPPHTAGLLLLLPPGQAAELGLMDCPVASVLAALQPQLLAEALYDMCYSAPDLVSELLVRCCRVPAVACLLTRTFDALGSGEEEEKVDDRKEEKEGVEMGKEGGQEVRGVADAVALGAGNGCAEGAGEEEGGRRGPSVRVVGFGLAKEEGATEAAGISGCGGGGRSSSKRGRMANGGDAAAAAEGSADGGGGGDGEGDTCKRQRRHNDSSSSAVSHAKAGCSGGGDGSTLVHARRSFPGVAAFFRRLYDTVEDPDQVFAQLLAGRAALNAAARQLLLLSVLA